ncbi:MAG: prolyl oligopeptidase family serine peptidase [Fimbriimonadaceae bacterium]|nr:S9 family peptidase [Chthonomonadaceae bacterium]MCO5298091.1 prolyl oligopeptidase family serine peptidase [Fimbriimonadaceae bacterium]
MWKLVVALCVVSVLAYPSQSRQGLSADKVDRFLDSLMKTESISNPNYEHYEFSPDGNWVVFTIARSFQEDDIYSLGDSRKLPGGIPVTFLRQDIWIASTRTGKLARITNGKPEKRSYWHPVWAPNSKDLAFYGDKDGQIVLWLCRNAQAHNAHITQIEGPRLKSTLFQRDRPAWTKDGKKVLIPLLPESETRVDPGVDDNPLFLIPKIYKSFLDPRGATTSSVLRSESPSDISRFLIAENRVDLGILDIGSGKLERLSENKDVMLWQLSPDGKTLAYKTFKRVIPGTFIQLFDLYVMPSEGGAARLLMEDVEDKLLWSPDSRSLLERKNGELYVVDVRGTLRMITPGKDPSFEKVFPQPDVLRASVGSYLWSPDGSHVLAQNKEGWWSLSSDGTQPPQRTFATEEETANVNISGVLRVKGTGYAFSEDGRSVLLETTDTANSRKNLLKADLKNGAMHLLSDRVPQYTALYDLHLGRSNSSILYSKSDMDVDNLWCSEFSFIDPVRITDLNLHIHEIPTGRKELFRYHNSDGQDLKGALLYPPAYVKGKRYPVVVMVYAGTLVTTLERAFPLSFNPVLCLPQLLSQCGYVVMQPSIPLSPEGDRGSPINQIPPSVLPAVDKLVELGVADPDNIGVIGHSYGGYTVHVLITQTNRFKAAVALAGISDLISNSGIFDARTRYSFGGASFFSSWSEAGQGRMGVPLWEDRLRWVENSPVFHLNNVETPLLMLHGDLDFISIAQAEEVYSGLVRLGKEAEFVRYFGEGHVLSKPINIRDSWHRIVDWFDRLLKPEMKLNTASSGELAKVKPTIPDTFQGRPTGPVAPLTGTRSRLGVVWRS